MLKKLKVIAVVLVLGVLLVACQKSQNNTIKMIYKNLSLKEEHLLTLTGNKVMMYKLKNLPKNKKYEILLTYEVYDKRKKTKEEVITGIAGDGTSSKNDTEAISLNLQEGKINFILGKGGSYANGSLTVTEEFMSYNQAFLVENVDLKLGTEIYIYHANSGESTKSCLTLGYPVSEEEINKVLRENDKNIFIKLSFKEVQ